MTGGVGYAHSRPCRAVGNSSGVDSWLGCSFSTGKGLSPKIDTYTRIPDWGPNDLRFLADVTGEGRARFVYQNPYLGGTVVHVPAK